MARRKEAVTIKEKYAVMNGGKFKQVVKAWQYYSVFGFCRGFGETREKASQIADWCRDKANNGEKYCGENYSITIEEREVTA